MKSRRLDLYVASEIAGPFALACAFFLLVFFMLQALRLVQLVLVSRIPLWTVLEISACMLLSFSHYVLPSAFLASLVIAFNRLSSEGELIAMRALGVAPRRALLPCFTLAAVVSGATLCISLSLAPWGERTMTELLYGAAHIKALPVIPARTFIRDFEGLVLQVDSVDSTSGELSGVFIRDEREAGAPLVIVARHGRLERVPATAATPGRIYLRLKDGNLLKTSTLSTLPTEKMDFHEYSLLIRKEPEAFVLPDHPRFNSVRQLLAKMGASPPVSQDYRDYSTELWKRIFFSLSPFALLLAGCGLGTLPIRAGNASGGMIAISVAAGYWFFLILSMAVAGSGSVPAFWAMQIPNWVSLVAGYLIYRRRRV